MKKSTFILFLGCLLTACGSQADRKYWQLSQQPSIFPDYTDITIPCNIAPLNFQVEDTADIRVSVLVVGTKRYEFKSRSALMQFPEKQWKKMLEAEKGQTLNVYLTVSKGTQDDGYRGFTWTVAPEPIDKYLSYRLIEPAYEVWNLLQIEERDLESFKTRLLCDNNITGKTCVNCHISNHAEKPATFMHVRGKEGGTIYARDGRVRKINTKTASSGVAVYGEISNNGRYGIFTTADIIPILHSLRNERLEVYDRRSDLIVIDFENGTVGDSPAVSGEEWQETFPCFSADNRTVYFCRAPRLPQPDSTKMMRYNLCSIDFNPETGMLGDSVRLVFDAASLGKSVSFPKCSPDGKYLLLSISDYGTFPIWHPETDLWMLDLTAGNVNRMEKTNDRFSDSYHSWSSNSKWIVFASKRTDAVYGRPCFACVNEDGTTTKAFVLPQKDPEYYHTTLKSFNIPELYNCPEQYDAHDIQRIYFKEATEQLNYN
ncbi:MAG: hypothetical protein LBH19_02230 [Dysgonamonadaceae bacterium]|jgi:hypothetical protein|nr:hypothetical protein [Dysgonamonadaceae bacterium]